jgi:hypothetical protein
MGFTAAYTLCSLNSIADDMGYYLGIPEIVLSVLLDGGYNNLGMLTRKCSLAL